MNNIDKAVLLNFLGWEAETTAELIQGMTEDDADWSVIHLNNWLWSKIEEIKGERYDNK